MDTLCALEATIGYSAKISVETSGIVHIQYPKDVVEYNSTPMMSCIIENEMYGSWNWDLIKGGTDYVLNNGSSITITSNAASNCTTVQITKLSGNWAGIYKCGFSRGSIVHEASAELKVALLPDTIIMTSSPLTIDCPQNVIMDNTIVVNATIQNSTENYTVTFNQVTSQITAVYPDGTITYSQTLDISCKPTTDYITITVSFMNQKNEKKSQSTTIPVINGNVPVCPEDKSWPKTPKGFTIVIRECPLGRVGYKERTCISPQWMNELDQCVSEEVNQALNAAADFKEGLGVTPTTAIGIFSSLKNSSNESSYSAADLSASVVILNIMFEATTINTLDDSVLRTFLGAASNMLGKDWGQVNTTISYNMSSSYLQSVEGLVSNMNINDSQGHNTQNIEVKICNNVTCNQTVFGVEVKLNQSSGTVNTLGIKNLSGKLNNTNYPSGIFSDIVVSATLQNSTGTNIVIQLDFPINQPVEKGSRIHCVFWNTTLNEWSKEGCVWKEMVNNKSYCECTHLTSFSVLMSKTQTFLPYLNEITYVGTGVSICSLLVFLLIEALVWSAVVKSNLSHFRHTALVNISLCLLLADCSFLAASATASNFMPSSLCLVLTLAQQFFFQAMFCWMLCLSIMLLHQLIFVFHPLRKSVYRVLSIVLGYVCPLVIVSATYVYYKFKNEPYNDTSTCWLKYTSPMVGSIHAFILPVGTIVFMNLFGMGVVIMTLLKSSISDGSKANEKETVKSIMKVILFLTPVFGVTWGLGFLMLTLDNTGTIGDFMQYAFTITNSLQGFFILLTGCFAEKRVRDEVLKMIMAGAPPIKGKTESMKNLTTKTTSKK
ncbi:hypothetical protein DPEC_G00086000 [Dallia pectoralis]|uniref:Uncharacterized protein n=1 Tax=Dallia pectoralis TaxID=75939 RepID=A0ACC2GZL2_DALPE|nr:hypothetical protein DPEC_G00086000 [Dallia pectoralis]